MRKVIVGIRYCMNDNIRDLSRSLLVLFERLVGDVHSECVSKCIHSSNEDTTSAVSEALPLSEIISHSYSELLTVLLPEVARS